MATQTRRLSLSVGPRIREVRKALGLTLNQLSVRTGISLSQLSKIETGKTHPTIPALLKISAALERSPTFFFLTEAEMPRSLATLMPLTGPEAEGLTAFAALVQRRTKGRMTLQILPPAGIDRFSEVPDTLLAGAIDMVIEGLAFYQSHAETIVPASLPFCFRGSDHYEAFLRSNLFREGVIGKLLNKGVRFLDPQWTWRRAPQVLVSRRPVFSPADLMALKIRVYDSNAMGQFWGRFGVHPVFVPWLQTQRALKDGTIDCVTVSAGLLAATGFTEVAQYVTFVDLCDAMITTVNVAVAEERYQLLPPAAQRVMTEAATQIGRDVTAMLRQRSQEGLAECIAQHGAIVSRINLAPFRERAQEIIRELERAGEWPDGLFESIQRIR